MNRRHFLSLSALSLASASTGCLSWRVDAFHPLIRSANIKTMAQEREILSRARLTRTGDQRIPVLVVRGSAYERGYQHGALLREEVQDNLGYIYEQAQKKFHFVELFAEVYERMRPYIPQEYIDEMHGLAHGSKLPLHVVHHLHILPEIGEWSGRKRIGKIIKQMIKGEFDPELGTSCSNFSITNSATKDREMYVVRILDWGLHRISKLHQYPLITVNIPESGIPSANIGWVGFLGAVSGMNAQGITLGEMGYGDPPHETLSGTPMPFVLRSVISQARNLADVRRIITGFPGTASFGYLMSDGKTKESELYIRDHTRFVVFKPGEEIKDQRKHFPAIRDTCYGGHYSELMTKLLGDHHGTISPELLMEDLIPQMAMPSNFQNVIYQPSRLRFWVSNAASRSVGAQREPFTLFDLGSLLAELEGTLNKTTPN